MSARGFADRHLCCALSDPGLATTEEQAEQSGVMLVSVPLAGKTGKLFSI